MAKGLRKPIARSRTPEQIRNLRGCLLISVGRWPHQVWGENGTHLLCGMINTIHTSVLSSEEVGRSQCVRIIPTRRSTRRYTIGRYVRPIRQRLRMFRGKIQNFVAQTWHQIGSDASRQPQVQRCSGTSPSTNHRHCPRRTHPSSSIVPRCTVLPVIVGRSGVLGMQRPERHCNQSKAKEQVPIRGVVRFTSPRRRGMAFPQVGHLQSKEKK